MKSFLSLLFFSLFFLLRNSSAQNFYPPYDSLVIDYSRPAEYAIGGITISGTQYLDKDILIAISGIKIGDRIDIPGQELTKAIQNLWKQGLFANVRIYVDSVKGDKIFLAYVLDERPRLSGFTFKGTKKAEEDEIRTRIALNRGKVLTDNIKINTVNTIQGYYTEKGYLNTKVSVNEVKDTTQQNSMLYYIYVDRGNRIKIDEIAFTGNNTVSDAKLHRLLKKTKENTWYPWSIFTLSRYKKKEYEGDKSNIITYYASKGYRDARILSDSVYKNEEGNLNIAINLTEGNKYYFRDINWTGNTKYSDAKLDSALRIKKGDVYNEVYLQQRLNGDQKGDDVGSLYMNDGYLFFQVTPVEINVENDSIDLEIRLHEGAQAIINRVNIVGNSKTHEHVVRRVIRTLPGSKFSRADVIRSQREIATLGFFDPEKLDIRTDPHPESGSVDLTYVVEEKPSDQVELSAGWGGKGTGVIGSLGVKFNNFSAKGILDRSSWTPLPSGDGQTLSLRFQSTGRRYQSFNVSFTEPWLGGHKPNSLSVGVFASKFTNNLEKADPNFGKLNTTGGSIGIGKQLKWPDDYFTLISSVNVTNYSLHNYTTNFFITEGNALSISLKETFGRNSEGPDYIFPKWGSNFYFSIALTPPYSLFSDKNYDSLPASEKYKLVEFHKERFLAEWYANTFGKFVLRLAAKGGYLGYYNALIGLPPFERFQLGGDGLSQSFSLYGIDFIAQRGYDVYTDPPASIFNKYTIELRYPFSTNPSAFVYGTIWGEAGNAWYSIKEYDPFNLKRAAGVGLRVFLPIFGTVGFDYGWGFDNPNVSTFNDFIKQGKFNIVLGFEPE